MLAGAGGFGLGNASNGSAGPRAAAVAGGPTSLTDALARIQSDLDAAQVFATSSPSASVSPSSTASPSPTSSVSVSPSVSPTPTSTTVLACLPSPSLCGFPDATNTGTPVGTVLTKKTGAMTVTVAGTVIDALDLTGTLNINANNVTVKNSHITSGPFFGIHLAPGVTGALITDTTVTGVGDCNVGINGGTYIAQRDNVSGCEDSFQISNGSQILDSYIHDLVFTATSHNDGIQAFSAKNMVLRHNTILIDCKCSPVRGNAAIFLQPTSSAITGVDVSDNLLDGAGYTVKVETSTGVVIARNVIGRHFRWGWLSQSAAAIKPTLIGNVFDDTGLPAT